MMVQALCIMQPLLSPHLTLTTVYIHSQTEANFEVGYNANMADVKLNHNITEEKLRTRMNYWSSSDPKAMDSDKTCIVCCKGNMSWPRYANHLDGEHGLYALEDNTEYLELEEVIYSWEQWINDLSANPPSRGE